MVLLLLLQVQRLRCGVCAVGVLELLRLHGGEVEEARHAPADGGDGLHQAFANLVNCKPSDCGVDLGFFSTARRGGKRQGESLIRACSLLVFERTE